MKNKLKKYTKTILSLLLVTALLLTDASFASAAKKISWKKKIAKLTVGQSFAFKVKKRKKSYTVIYRSSNKKIASIHKKSGKCKAKKAGKVKIKAIIRNKKGKKVKTLSTTLRIYNKNISTTSLTGKNSSISKQILSDKNSSPEQNNPQDKNPPAGNTNQEPAGNPSSPSPALPSAPSDGNSDSHNEHDTNPSPSQDDILKNINITEVSALNNWNFTVRLTLNRILVAKDLQNTSIHLLHTVQGTRLTAYFKSLEKDGFHASYQISDTDSRLLKPGNRSMDGAYSLSSADLQCSPALTTSYEEALKANTVQGFVCDTFYQPLAGVRISLENGEHAFSDKNGFYCLYSEEEKVTLVASKASYASETFPDILLNSTTAVTKNIILGNHGDQELSCRLHVTDEDGSSLSGISLSLFNQEGILLGTGCSDKEGNLTFCNEKTGCEDFAAIVPSDGKSFFNRTDYYTVKAEKEPSASDCTNTYKTGELTFTFADTPFSCITKELVLSHNKPVERIPFRISWETSAWNTLNTSTPTLLVDFLDRDGQTSLLPAPVATTLSAEEVNHSVLLELVEDTTLFFDEPPCLPDGIYYLKVKDFSSRDGKQVNATTIVPVAIQEEKRTPIKEAIIKPAASVQISAVLSELYNTDSLHFLSPGMPVTTIRDALVQKDTARNETDTISTKYYLYETINHVSVLVDTFYSSPYLYQIADNKKQIQSTALLSRLEANKTYYLAAPDSYVSLAKEISIVPDGKQIKTYTPSHVTRSSLGEIRIVPESGDAFETCGNYIEIEYIQITGTTTQFHTKVYPQNSYAYRTKNGEFSIAPGGEPLYGADLAAGVVNKNPSGLFTPFSSFPPGKYDICVKFKNCTPVKTLSPIEIIDFEKTSVTITDRVSRISDTILTGSITRNGFPLMAADDSDKQQPAGTIMLYDAEGKIAAGKDIPSGSSHYTLTNNIDGHFTDGLYHLVVRGNQLETYDTYISIQKEATNRLDISLASGGRAALQVSLPVSTIPSILKEQTLCLSEKDTLQNTPGNWKNFKDYRKLSYTGEYKVTPMENENLWSTGSILPTGIYLLTSFDGYYSPDIKEIQITEKNKTREYVLDLPEYIEKAPISYTITLPSDLDADADALVWVALFDSHGECISLRHTTYGEASVNGISVSALQKEEQTARLYLQGHLLMEQPVFL